MPAFVALHHPPAPGGIAFLDAMGLADADALAEVTAAHPRVVRVLAGHVHRPLTTAFAATVLPIAPSTYRTSELAMRPDRAMGHLDEPTSVLLHQVDASTGGARLTYTLPVSHAGALRHALLS